MAFISTTALLAHRTERLPRHSEALERWRAIRGAKLGIACAGRAIAQMVPM